MKTQRDISFIIQLLVGYIPTLASIEYCNICLATITPMLQHTSMEVFDQLYNIGYWVP